MAPTVEQTPLERVVGAVPGAGGGAVTAAQTAPGEGYLGL